MAPRQGKRGKNTPRAPNRGMKMDMLLYLLKPGRLAMGEELLRGAVEAEQLHDGPMPWLVQSDILVAKGREFVGLVLYAGEPNADVAREFAAACDPRIALYLPNQIAAGIPRYHALAGRQTSVLELRWSRTETDEERLAQLNENWYYKTGDDPENVYPRAWGFPGIEDILESEGLVFPADHY